MGIPHPAAYARAIVIEGNASPPGRFRWHQVQRSRKTARAARLSTLWLPRTPKACIGAKRLQRTIVEDVMKGFLLSALALAMLGGAPVVAQAAQQDVAKISCKDFLNDKDHISLMVMWIDGYMPTYVYRAHAAVAPLWHAGVPGAFPATPRKGLCRKRFTQQGLADSGACLYYARVRPIC